MHPDGPQLGRATGHLSVEAQGHALIGLESERQGIGIELILRREQDVGRTLELDANLARAERQVLAGSDVERNPVPTPIVHEEAHRQEGLDVRVGLHLGLAAISRPSLPVDFSGKVLTSHNILSHLRRGHWPDGLEQLDLLVADILSLK